MSECENYIEKLEKLLPDMVRTKDLIALGIFDSNQAAFASRRNKTGPEFFQMNKRVVKYPKKSVIDYMKSKIGSNEN